MDILSVLLILVPLAIFALVVWSVEDVDSDPIPKEKPWDK